jgi:hypothetical protein
MALKTNAAVIDQPVSSTRQEWDISPSKAGQMNVAVVEQFGKPLLLQEWDIPSPGTGQILIKTEACGVCHTDLHAAHGDIPEKIPPRPSGDEYLRGRRRPAKFARRATESSRKTPRRVYE